jgi:hypothetical protein
MAECTNSERALLDIIIGDLKKQDRQKAFCISCPCCGFSGGMPESIRTHFEVMVARGEISFTNIKL